MNCRWCGEPIRRCHGMCPLCRWLCTGWQHAHSHYCRTGHDVRLALPAPAQVRLLDMLEAVDGPDYEWRREFLEEFAS